ncbi:MAG: hypothetical protein R3D68_10725 [Hyphomicrobiaceae bacterium]
MMSRKHPYLGGGVLSIWNDMAPEAEEFYERWYMTEHFPERLAVPGFLRGRRYVAIDADRKYFTFYDLESPDVLFSKAYLERLEAPTVWTQTVMRSWSNMFRTVCERVRRKGDAIGGFALAARWEGATDLPVDLADRIAAALTDPRVVAVDAWRATSEQNAGSKEASTRATPDATISAALVVETTSEGALTAVRDALPQLLGDLPGPGAVGLYRLIALQDAVP